MLHTVTEQHFSV